MHSSSTPQPFAALAPGAAQRPLSPPGAVLACDECYPRQARAVWTFKGTDAAGRPWRAMTCNQHVSLIDEELAERGGYGSLEPLAVPPRTS
ncbi:hypothetical protein [Kineococcus sp. SYSU DK003]|uniref:hypothetical protein n=1 Tax=Kineococcus sp. SYSU DK003 TaxID=3383124 RepID=UPI003D7C88D1